MLISVRPEFTEEKTWREALGPDAPLLCYSDEIPTLDAPEWIPAGSMRASNYTNRARVSRFLRGGE